LGEPYGGFPEPFRSNVLHGRKIVQGRPGASLPPFDFDKEKSRLISKYGASIRESDVLSYARYPSVFEEFMLEREKYGPVHIIPTRYFLKSIPFNHEISIELSSGRTVFIVLNAVGPLDKKGYREVYFELNGSPRFLSVFDKSTNFKQKTRPKVDASNPGSIGAPMSGVVIDIRVQSGIQVKMGDPLLVLSAMKMETVVSAPISGFISKIYVEIGDSLSAGDLLILMSSAMLLSPAVGRMVSN